MPVSENVVKQVKKEYHRYGLLNGMRSDELHEGLLDVCATVTNSKNSYLACITDGAKMVRKKIRQIREKFSDRLSEPVTDEIVKEVIDELNAVKAPDGSSLGDIQRNLIMACAKMSKNVDELFICIDEGNQIPIILNKDLMKLL